MVYSSFHSGETLGRGGRVGWGQKQVLFSRACVCVCVCVSSEIFRCLWASAGYFLYQGSYEDLIVIAN
jgi:hypothetical protein